MYIFLSALSLFGTFLKSPLPVVLVDANRAFFLKTSYWMGRSVMLLIFQHIRNIIHVCSRQCDEFRYLYPWINNPFIGISIFAVIHSNFLTTPELDNYHLLLITIQWFYHNDKIKISASFNDELLALTLYGMTGYSTVNS